VSSLAIQFLNGLAGASTLFLVAVGLSLIFGVTRVVNFAHGSLYMLGIYIAYSVISRAGGGEGLGPAGFWGGILVAAIVVGAVGALIEILLLRRIYHAPELFQLLATFGVVLVIKDFVLWAWGPEDLLGPRAPGLRGSVDILGRPFPEYDLALVVIGGNVDLRAGALVEGDLVNPGGRINREPGAEVRGNLVTQFNFQWMRNIHIGLGVSWFSGVWQLAQAVALTGVALLLMLIIPDHVARTADIVARKPMAAGGLGLITFILLPFALIITIITLVLPPVILLVVIFGYVFGWVALGFHLGKGLANTLNADWSRLMQGALGTFLLSLAAGFVAWIPCVGWLAGLGLGMVGLGAVLLTRFGTLQEPAGVTKPATKPKAAKGTVQRAASRSGARKK